MNLASREQLMRTEKRDAHPARARFRIEKSSYFPPPEHPERYECVRAWEENITEESVAMRAPTTTREISLRARQPLSTEPKKGVRWALLHTPVVITTTVATLATATLLLTPFA